ncbi:hypothetical protein C7T87_12330 [Xanthomonas hortorum pv. hederae]|nr:hypothetical protein C7T87_12330 [Xanthomonas hortorum pv. hederae]
MREKMKQAVLDGGIDLTGLQLIASISHQHPAAAQVFPTNALIYIAECICKSPSLLDQGMQSKILEMIAEVYLLDASGDQATDEPPFDTGYLPKLMADRYDWLDTDLHEFLMDHSFPDSEGPTLVAVTGNFKLGDRSKIYDLLIRHQCVPCDAEW